MQRILIANRGEIALRIIKTCQRMGVETIAIYSDADESLPYVQAATKAVRIGEPPVMKSYLKGEEIIRVAKELGADAIHPGYGFLSENADFAEMAEKDGFTFIGPDSETIRLMGDKVASRTTMEQAGVPVVPGSSGGVETIEAAARIATEIGYPVMLKASSGGGGIGMVKCHGQTELEKSFASVKARAKAYFGSDAVFLEKFIENARHIEVQVFGDSHGNIVHLFERDCSIQRRNQKVVEESPSPFLSEGTRNKLFETALKAAKAVSYKNAGTIEFIFDEDENFYFLEMNTRLQVEHPVTEEITGIDLVEWQILAASGEKIPLTQSEITSQGHAIEFRLYAEDPVRFLPSPGKINAFSFEKGNGTRIDSGYGEENTVTPYYDPMIAKCIFSGESRAIALSNATKFFDGLTIEGIKTNAPLFKQILQNKDFTQGNYTTAFLNEAVLKN
ncbi:acetyl-CoA carboxylase biotin carboxylase subunit [Neobacillus notoginsengisoli]|uniref:biotin carboxylase n=1 Tax=Neobacillus notoginsengisoli TaxID=1578198 RepID=A0A417YQX1_9BACI|nr:acetyl-CoA carboxylase biotin carboxylase subunit [Neobacillus notoginsengisoli]RHW36512.1 acetyl-CoA carboxylase biotin carboxylase subunit [Neobacillus notoginsengisoli]